MPAFHVLSRAPVPDDFSNAEAGMRILDEAYFFDVVRVDGDLILPSSQDFMSQLSEALLSDDACRRHIARNEGAQLVLSVRGSLRATFPLEVGGLVPCDTEALNRACGTSFVPERPPELRFCLGVHGDLEVPALVVGPYSHASIGGDLQATYVEVSASDGALLYCAGEVETKYYIHSQAQPPLRFVSAPTECAEHELASEFRHDRQARIDAVLRGEPIV